jgi:hypothetical protein
MKNRKFSLLIRAAVALVAIWTLALAIFHFSARAKITAEKVRQFIEATDLGQLPAAQREQAIIDLENKVNSLSLEERMKWRREDSWKKWFAEMTETERKQFIESTLPTGFKQMMDSFSQLPSDQRKKLIDDAVKNLQLAGSGGVDRSVGDYGKNGPPPLSPELEKDVREIGLTEVYADSSAETKAELAPLLEQIQAQIQRGRTH